MRARPLMRSALLVAGALLLSGETCGQPVIDDSGFDLWCGSALCDWNVDAGQVRRVPTWHEADPGVELVSDTVVLSQTQSYQDFVASAPPQCLHFDLLADIDDSAQVFFEIDLDNDGVIDFSQRIPAGHWESHEFVTNFPLSYSSARYIVRKASPGHAVVAVMNAVNTDDTADQCGGTMVDLHDRPLGSHCKLASECSDGFCESGPGFVSACSDCEKDSDCSCGRICSVAYWQFLGVIGDAAGFACLAPGSEADGYACSEDAACGSGKCCATTKSCGACP